MRSLPITATDRLLRRVHRALGLTARRRPAERPTEDDVAPDDVSIVERELTRC
ncbi:hypothetical protein [Mycobacterium sp. IS-1742]|uniref:hypothetical protein n=1 Tax=Mycobacterium sp. IS-1742 TaxID=1772285 RepID=UPI000B0D251F|nr:hypothetical protein [Mycobacterium sp. IS-1742]